VEKPKSFTACKKRLEIGDFSFILRVSILERSKDNGKIEGCSYSNQESHPP
jgi:hypothetical protein